MNTSTLNIWVDLGVNLTVGQLAVITQKIEKIEVLSKKHLNYSEIDLGVLNSLNLENINLDNVNDIYDDLTLSPYVLTNGEWIEAKPRANMHRIVLYDEYKAKIGVGYYSKQHLPPSIDNIFEELDILE